MIFPFRLEGFSKMSKKKKKEDPVIHFSLDGTLPEAKPHIIMKKRKKKKYNVEHELDNTRMDMIQ